jgi:hypothetical protein
MCLHLFLIRTNILLSHLQVRTRVPVCLLESTSLFLLLAVRLSRHTTLFIPNHLILLSASGIPWILTRWHTADGSLLGCDAVWSCTWLPAFRRNVCPLYSFYPQNRSSQISEISTLLELLTDVKKITRVYPTVLRNITSVNQINYYSSSLHLPAFIILSWNLELSAVPWLRRFFAGLSPRRHGFASGSVHVGFVVDKAALVQLFYEFFGYPLSVSFHRRCPRWCND